MKLRINLLQLLFAVSVLTLLGCHTGSKGKSSEAHKSKTGNLDAIVSLANDPLVMGPARQLTFVGPRAGEGYFSADGREMIFQSERDPNNPFYQIYLMNLETGKTQRVSPGKGQTTCAWIHPTQDKVMFSSTHLDPQNSEKVKKELESRKSGVKAKYSWSYDETYDIFEYSKSGRFLRRLTKEKGYDAEGSYSPDGQWIAFASNRAGYTEKLSSEEAKLFKQDPSYMMDIYIMKADGTALKQLTTTRGYDGGPFFSSDGKKITWRRFTPDGHSAEIYTMNVDGSEQKPVTRIGAMSWAPYFHPSGDYLIFTSNVLGYQNFELFIVDAQGKSKPVRVSYKEGFDGLPVFSPNGTQISWTHRNEKGESQIYMAPWSDARARELLGLKPMSESPHGPSNLSPQIRVSDAQQWVQYLASEKMGGRMSGSREEVIYTTQMANQLAQWGLQPVQGQNFVQTFKFTSGTKLGPKNRLSVERGGASQPVLLGAQWQPLALSRSGEVAKAAIVFAGHGIVAPATENQKAFDSYGDIDVKDKWVLALSGIPEDVDSQRRFHLNIYARDHHKAMVARNRGARGLILIQPEGKPLKLGERNSGGSNSGLPVLSVSAAWAKEILSASAPGQTPWKDLLIKLNKGEVQAFQALGVTLSAHVDLELVESEGRNVVAMVKVPGAKSSVIIGAHGDHLGHGEAGDSLAQGAEKGMPHVGADDNASGVSVVLELAHYFADAQRRGKIDLKQNLIFAIWSGEELGVLGSSHFVKEGLAKNISASINLDMVGRYRDLLMVQGTGSAREWTPLLERWATQTPLSVTLQSDPYLPTDAMALYLGEVPSISFFTGAHGEYHTPRDTPDLLNWEGVGLITEWVGMIGREMASNFRPLVKYQKVEGSKRSTEGRGFRLYLGTIPDYAQEGVTGVKISGTGKSSPAEKAGLRTGDIIVELDRNKIENIYDYVYCLQSMKANQPVPVKVMREGRMVELKITPILKE